MEYNKIDPKTWLLNTPLDYFLKFTNLDKRWHAILKGEFSECKTTGDLLNLDTRSYNSARGVGITSWKNLMKAFYEFGITDCFDYPIAQNPQRCRMTKKYIDECKSEIAKSRGL